MWFLTVFASESIFIIVKVGGLCKENMRGKLRFVQMLPLAAASCHMTPVWQALASAYCNFPSPQTEFDEGEADMHRTSALCERDFSTVEWSLCPCFMCGPRSTSVLGLRILQSYVPLRAGRCESLPHMKYRTGGDISQLLLNPAFIYNRSSGYLIKPQLITLNLNLSIGC